MQPNGAAHKLAPAVDHWRRVVFQKERQLLSSFRNSFKKGKKEVKSVFHWLQNIATCVFFPILSFWEFVQLVRMLFIVGWQKGFSSVVLTVLRRADAPLKRFGAWVEDLAFQLFGGYDLTETTEDTDERPLSIIGVLDKNVQLQPQTVALFPSPTPSSRPNADVCVMAAKIVYEREDVVRDIINSVWNTQVVEGGKVKGITPPTEKFEFIKWFSYIKQNPEHSVETQAMLFKKGHAYVVAFRGTEPFSAVDWATDFYFPWYEFPALGRVHTGFLNSLGLGYPPDDHPPMGRRKGTATGSEEQCKAAKAQVEEANQAENEKLDDFVHYIEACMTRFDKVAEQSTLDEYILNEQTEHFRDMAKWQQEKKDVFKSKYVCASEDPKSDALKSDVPLYWQIRGELKRIVREDAKATIFVTGHSLGGALAALFTGLISAESDVIARKIGALYTFGQPRVGDWTFAWFLHNRLNVPQHRYIRMVYNNDLVPHVPFDSDTFEFKHLGPFHWADALYHVRIGTFNEQPRINFPIAHLTAFFELWYNTVWNAIANLVFRPRKFQRPTESIPQVLARLSAVFLPAIGAHSPVNYVNAVRHGMPEGKVKKAPVNTA